VLIHRHYERRRLDVAVRPEIVIPALSRRQRVFVPVREVTRDVVNAIRFGRTMADEVVAVHVTDDPERAAELRERFERQLPDVPFVVVESPYRTLVGPLVRWLELEAADAGDDLVVVLLPEVVATHWWERWLHNDNARRIRQELLGRPGILIAQVPFGRPVGRADAGRPGDGEGSPAFSA